jgi:adenine-specific DNA-methyltransferase
MGTQARKENVNNILPFKREVNAHVECKDNLEYMRSLKKESMNLIVTSPPYNIGKSYEKRTTNAVYIEHQTAAIAEAVRLLHPK